MAYKNDVFISYKRDYFKDEWLADTFMPLFMYYIREEIAAASGRNTIGVYFDQTAVSTDFRKMDQHGLEPGDEWRKALRDAIRTSRCVVCLWQPTYFFSRWCTIEWQSFRDRGAACGTKLVVPMSVHDGQAFPKEARDFLPDNSNFSDYVIVGDGFKKTEDYPKFQKALKTFAITVAKCVKEAPDFSDTFEVTDYKEPAAPPEDPFIPQQRITKT